MKKKIILIFILIFFSINFLMGMEEEVTGIRRTGKCFYEDYPEESSKKQTNRFDEEGEFSDEAETPQITPMIASCYNCGLDAKYTSFVCCCYCQQLICIRCILPWLYPHNNNLYAFDCLYCKKKNLIKERSQEFKNALISICLELDLSKPRPWI